MKSETMHPTTTELTRIPQQARSREKFDAILAEALRLIHEKGYEHVSVREIARAAGMPIASVYQYFPNKLAIVRQLWERYTETLAELLASELATLVSDPTEATRVRVINDVVDHMVANHRDNPAFLEIWRAVDGAPELRALNREDSLRVAEAVTSAILTVRPDADRLSTLSRALIAGEAASATVKLAQELPAELRAPIYENLKLLLVSMLSDAM
jgi:AcrR family transcriptional regulator